MGGRKEGWCCCQLHMIRCKGNPSGDAVNQRHIADESNGWAGAKRDGAVASST
jgi:hypothetical protein